MLLAFFGPLLAPQDPLKENFLVFLNDTAFVKPPFPAFATPGFPLGSDEFGRDLFSRLLWGIRPTFTLVLVVASVRLIIGTILGLISGWSDRWPARLIHTILSAGLAVPVLFVALFVIAAAGQQSGIWAFIIGLSITGWCDAARLIREQTRQVRLQAYVEASVALGAGSFQIIFSHVLPHVVYLVWVILSFEVSAAMIVTAELGVLGYFIHAVWIPLGDWVGIRASGVPELGQMLSNLQRQPWGAISAGGIFFLTVMGLNLLGEGLRTMTSHAHRLSQSENTIYSTSAWVEEQIFNPLTPFRRLLPTFSVLAALLTVTLGGGLWLVQSQAQAPPSNGISLPGGNQWIADGRDSQGTRYSSVSGPSSARIAWSVQASGGFTGGPVISAGGTVYLATIDKKILAVNPDGKLLWSAFLPNEPVGSPALGITGNIFVTDSGGGLTRVNPEGQVSELVPSTGKFPALSGPITGSDETVYFATTEELFAVSDKGQRKWQVPLPTYSLTNPIPHLSADDRYLIFEDFLIDTSNGKIAAKASPDPLDKIIVGTDRKLYRVSQAMMTELNMDGKNPPVIHPPIKWDIRTLGISLRFPRDAGVAPDGKIWISYGSEYDYARLVWLDRKGEFLAAFDYPYRGYSAPLIGIDSNELLFNCGSIDAAADQYQGRKAECRANRIGSNAPVWRLTLEDTGIPVGGALILDRLYVATSSGNLFLIVSE